MLDRRVKFYLTVQQNKLIFLCMLTRKEITALMADCGITSQRDLAKTMGMNEGQLSRLLNMSDISNVELSSIGKLCGALHCQPGDILSYNPAVKT